MTTDLTTTLLTAVDVRNLVRHVGLDTMMDETIVRLTDAFRRYDPDRTRVAVRDGFTYTEPHVGLLEMMPVLEPGGHATIKIVGYHPSNPERVSLPTILSTVAVFDSSTGHLIGLVDGTFLTAVRTAAASAVATQVFAIEDARTLGIIGCGGQAVAQLHAISRVRPIRRVLAYDIEPARAKSLAARLGSLRPDGLEIEACDLATVTNHSDVICTATSVGVGEGPVFSDGEMQPHVHINAVGADLPGKTELPLALLKRSFICPDFPDQTRREGECQQLDPEDVGPSIVDVIQAGDAYHEHRNRPTVFDSTGFALEDHVAAGYFFESAASHGLGTRVQFECSAKDPWNPYGFVDDEDLG